MASLAVESHMGSAVVAPKLYAAPGKSGLHARGEGERVLALESREGTRASRRVDAGNLGVHLE